MGLATEAADMLGCPLPMGEAAEKVYGEIIEADGQYATKDRTIAQRACKRSKGRKPGLDASKKGAGWWWSEVKGGSGRARRVPRARGGL